MSRRVAVAILTSSYLALVPGAARLGAQRPPAWRVVGAPPGAPAGCSNTGAAEAIDAFFSAMRSADSTALAVTTATRLSERFVFSAGGFTESDPFVAVRTIRDLVRYARRRSAQHERLTVKEVTFNEWRGQRLEFGPVYFVRAADDLGPQSLEGIGKGEFWCGQGVTVLNTAPANRARVKRPF
jgi:hypothetical protein